MKVFRGKMLRERATITATICWRPSTTTTMKIITLIMITTTTAETAPICWRSSTKVNNKNNSNWTNMLKFVNNNWTLRWRPSNKLITSRLYLTLQHIWWSLQFMTLFASDAMLLHPLLCRCIVFQTFQFEYFHSLLLLLSPHMTSALCTKVKVKGL